MESVMVVCKVYKLFKDGENFTKESKKVIRNRCVIPRWYAEDKNAKWKQNGRWHEINEEATKEYYEEGLKRQELKRKAKETKGKLAEILTNVIEEGASKATTDDTPKEDKNCSLAELRLRYPAITSNSKDKFLVKINELKSK
jgi:hypothetical protein